MFADEFAAIVPNGVCRADTKGATDDLCKAAYYAMKAHGYDMDTLAKQYPGVFGDATTKFVFATAAAEEGISNIQNDGLMLAMALSPGATTGSYVFYSGKGTAATATKFAEQTGGTVMNIPDEVFNGMTNEQVWAYTSEASRQYAMNATGPVDVFLHNASPSGHFWLDEFPILYENANVQIFFHGR